MKATPAGTARQSDSSVSAAPFRLVVGRSATLFATDSQNRDYADAVVELEDGEPVLAVRVEERGADGVYSAWLTLENGDEAFVAGLCPGDIVTADEYAVGEVEAA